MLFKAGIAAFVLICTGVTLPAIDLRQLYDEMYPVNGLRRDVLNLCQQVKPTFVRAVEGDRVGCYDSMPDPVELAIGWVRTSSRLAAMRPPTPVEVAERLLIAAIKEQRLDRLATPRLGGYAMLTGTAPQPCEDAGQDLRPAATAADLALALSDDRLALRAATGVDAALAAVLGIGPRTARRDAARPELPVLSLGGGDPVVSGATQAPQADPAPASDLGGDAAAALLLPHGAAAACKTPV